MTRQQLEALRRELLKVGHEPYCPVAVHMGMLCGCPSDLCQRAAAALQEILEPGCSMRAVRYVAGFWGDA